LDWLLKLKVGVEDKVMKWAREDEAVLGTGVVDGVKVGAG
jgi:hypothetical protein